MVQQTKTATAASIPIAIEQRIIETIAAPLHGNETSRIGHERKERELAALIETLNPAQSLALSKRLAVNAANDPLAIAFGRLVVERRNRLVAFLERRRRCR